FEKNDILEILLISDNKEATELFQGRFQDGKSVTTYFAGISAKGGFLIDQNGKIALPYIGEVQAEGKLRSELAIEISNLIKEYIKNPIVQINILNFKITVLGEVKQPATINIPNEKVSLIQAIATAGDFTNFGNKKEVHVIREVNGERKEFIVNMTDKSIFQSEVYFLKQNDIVYIPALKSKTFMSNNQLILPFVSFTSLLLTALNLILK
ncbi:MAG: polysaccharide biosynthesis/export family protein, partial [Bacteroidota bacterium]